MVFEGNIYIFGQYCNCVTWRK